MKQLPKLRKTLAQQGYSLTGPRRLVFEHLQAGQTFSWRELAGQLTPIIDRSTLYRTLKLFIWLGVIHEFGLGKRRRYELSDVYRPHHHHLHCLNCGQIAAISDARLEQYLQELAQTHQFRLERHQLELEGHCRECWLRRPIGVFDSGIGGRSIAAAIEKLLPIQEIIYESDSQNVPYGAKTGEQIYHLTKAAVQRLVDQDCQLVVIACNTATTSAIHRLREDFTLPLVGIEPMLKPAAAMTRRNVIAVLATRGTLSSRRYQELKTRYAAGKTVIDIDATDWVALIEAGQLDEQLLLGKIQPAMEAGADVIVLGCTHYHAVQAALQKLIGRRAVVCQPAAAVARQVQRILEQPARKQRLEQGNP